MPLDVIIEDERWSEFGLETLVQRAIEATLLHFGYDVVHWEVSVLGCNDARIADLNGDFRAKRQPTNVLSWPSVDRFVGAGKRPKAPTGDPELGDIAISYETCKNEAKSGNKPLEHHVTHLIVHGVLHLLGYDHESDDDADLMEATEIAILEGLGIANPYE